MNMQTVKDESASPSFIDLPDGRRLAYMLSEGALPGVVFMGGFKSDMTGAKATALETFCRKEGRRFLRFDYTGHGRSSGDFRQGTIGAWKQDALDMLDKIAPGKNILVGSSMGAWIMLLLALARPESVAGLVGIASAPDFTERLIWDKLDDAQKEKLKQEGVLYFPDCYGGEPYPITHRLIEEGRNHLLLTPPSSPELRSNSRVIQSSNKELMALEPCGDSGHDGTLPIHVPVRLIHGINDNDVPWQTSLALMGALASLDITLELIKNGDHRLSQPEQLAAICRMVACHPALACPP